MWALPVELLIVNLKASGAYGSFRLVAELALDSSSRDGDGAFCGDVSPSPHENAARCAAHGPVAPIRAVLQKPIPPTAPTTSKL